MRIVIKIDTGNAAFQENEDEVLTIMRRVAQRVSDQDRDGILRDTNGNRVGEFKVTGK